MYFLDFIITKIKISTKFMMKTNFIYLDILATIIIDCIKATPKNKVFNL